jgi:PAS domain S-box-containing protein
LQYNPVVERTRFILFLASGRSNLHLMAECLARRIAPKRVEIISANMSPVDLDPLASSVMAEKGFDLAAVPSRSPLDVELFTFDLVVTLGDFDQSCRPNLPGMPPHLHWDLPQPRPSDNPERSLELLREARDLLAQRVDALVASGVLHALFVSRRNFELILDNLGEGVIAHTMSRRIFYFNQAAERMTGMRREQVLGHDCHELFQGRLCGVACAQCSPDSAKSHNGGRQTVLFGRVDGEQRMLEKATTPLADPDGQHVGALVLLKDITELDTLKRRLKHHHAVGGMIGKDPKMLALFDLIREVASVNVPVLIEGESGTGKELVANAIHDLSPRADKPFVAINCGALPEGILESELFGHVRGAFSGAVQNKKGRFELADGGTIFLDEVGELSPAMQVKLLRVLQEQTFERVGGETPVRVDVRVISATNQNLRRMMERKQFRRDLFYRLCVVPIGLPPLRERAIDIPMLVEHFLERTARQTGKELLRISNEAIDVLMAYGWPGNVRELRNAIEYAYVKCRSGVVEPEHLPPEVRQREGSGRAKPGPALSLRKDDIIVALAKTGGNKKEAAKLLGVGRATLYRYLYLYGLS